MFQRLLHAASQSIVNGDKAAADMFLRLALAECNRLHSKARGKTLVALMAARRIP